MKDELNFDSAENLANKGIDIFNPNDSFFNDLCHKFDNEKGKDIILTDRRNEIYQNSTFCEDGCSYSGIDYYLMTAICICDSNALQEEKNITNDNKVQSEDLNFKDITQSFIGSLLDVNIEVIFCYNLVIDIQIMLKNIGFYFMFIMLILQIIFFIIYSIKKLKPIENFMFIFSNNKNKRKYFSPHKNNNIDINKTNNSNIKYKKKEIKNKDYYENKLSKNNNIKKNKIDLDDISNNELKSKNNNGKINLLNSLLESQSELVYKNNNKSKNLGQNKNNYILKNNYAPIINIKVPILNINNEKKNSLFARKINNFISRNQKRNRKSKGDINNLLTKIKNNNDVLCKIKRKTNNRRAIKNKPLNNIETTNENKYNKKSNFNKLSRTNGNILDMEYEEAMIVDKSTCIRIYWLYLVDSQIILGTFCTENYLDLFVIKLSFLVFTFEISFFLNALFYTDDYISEAYHNDGVLDFVSGLPKSIYSFIATLITTNLLRMLSSSKSELMKIIRYNFRYNYLYLIKAKLKKLRNKLIVYFILVFLLGFCFLYYVTAFCAVYVYSQKYWFFGCIESFAIDFAISLILCIFIAFMRYIAVKKRIKCLYILSSICSAIL